VIGGTCLRGGLTWEDLADGRPHRLKRGRHFRGDVRTVQAEGALAAEEMGRGMLATRDELGHHNHYVWVQFPDQALIEGEPCRCGGRTFERMHELVLRCDSCGATAAIQRRPVAPAGARLWRPGQRLSDYADVELTGRDPDAGEGIERWYGRGVDPYGEDVALEVSYVVRDGSRVPDPVEEGGWLHQVRRWPVARLARAASFGAFDDWSAADDLDRELRRRSR
jgi:hypothetical protein